MRFRCPPAPTAMSSTVRPPTSVRSAPLSGPSRMLIRGLLHDCSANGPRLPEPSVLHKPQVRSNERVLDATLRRRWMYRRLFAIAAGVLLIGASPAAAVNSAQPGIVSNVPAEGTPAVLDGVVNAVAEIGGKVV